MRRGAFDLLNAQRALGTYAETDYSLAIAAIWAQPETIIHPKDTQLTPPRGSPILWAVYLGMSWTWVIGMFLPVLLVRDYGGIAWWIFAVPNVVGAAAMGWVMRTRERSERVVTTHADACRIFSLVTIAFHLFFAIWMLPALLGNAGWIVAGLAVQLSFTPLLRAKGLLIAPALALIVSVAIAIQLHQHGLLVVPQAHPAGVGFVSVKDDAGLAMVCLLGFLTCPYLDLTFHRARRATSDIGAKIAFGLGFGVFFCSMIVLTLLYATHFASLKAPAIGATLLGIHMSLQIALTVALHARASLEEAEQRDDVANYRAALGAALALGLAGGMIAYFARAQDLHYAGLAVGEIVYRIFLSFYGLIAPAYVLSSKWLRTPTRVGSDQSPQGSAWKTTFLIVGVALPFYWLAFVERQMWFAIIGVALVVAAAWWRGRTQITASPE